MTRTSGIRWRTVLMGLPKRRFTAAELARAIPDPPDLSLRLATLLNLFIVVGVIVPTVEAATRAAWLLVVLPYSAIHLAALWAVWRDPGRPWTRVVYYVAPLVLGVVVGLLRDTVGTWERAAIVALAVTAALSSLVLWFAIVYRHQYVERRLAELDERDRALEMGRRLAAAQVRPHFLFNSLAALQHWVRQKDDRGAPMLEALTGYLRATLPLFDRDRLALGDELLAARRYLEVMRLRLGERLMFSVSAEAGTEHVPVPPGLLLTLVENAVEHGVMPSLQPVHVVIDATRVDGRLKLVVSDDGAGYAPADTPDVGGVRGLGLSSIRQRLRQAHGAAASLEVSGAPGTGCRVCVELPLASPAPLTPMPATTANPA